MRVRRLRIPRSAAGLRQASLEERDLGPELRRLGARLEPSLAEIENRYTERGDECREHDARSRIVA